MKDGNRKRVHTTIHRHDKLRPLTGLLLLPWQQLKLELPTSERKHMEKKLETTKTLQQCLLSFGMGSRRRRGFWWLTEILHVAAATRKRLIFSFGSEKDKNHNRDKAEAKRPVIMMKGVSPAALNWSRNRKIPKYQNMLLDCDRIICSQIRCLASVLKLRSRKHKANCWQRHFTQTQRWSTDLRYFYTFHGTFYFYCTTSQGIITHSHLSDSCYFTKEDTWRYIKLEFLKNDVLL